MIRRRSIPATLAATFVLSALAAPAFAENSFESSISGWLPGVETRDWDDANKDDVSTRFAAKQCDYDTAGQDVKNITMELNRNDTYTPDEHYGDKLVACSPYSSLTTVGWGDHGKGNFDMTLKKVDGQTSPWQGRLYVTYVKISY